LLGPGGAAGVDLGEFLEPLAFQPVDQPPQLEELLGQGGVGEAGQVLGVELVHVGGQGRQRVRPPV
jgi:hypothetical protein